MTKPTKKVSPKFPAKPDVQKKVSRKKSGLAEIKSLERHANSWVVIGFDTSPSSLAGAAFGYDCVLRKFLPIKFVIRRWSKDDHYFDRLEMCAKSHELVLDLLAELNISVPLDRIWIAQEEPWPPRAMGQSGFLKQQAEISGAFLGGLLRYGYKGLWQIGSHKWRGVIRDQLIEDGKEPSTLTLHHTKWRSEKLVARFNCRPADSGKFRSKQWALDVIEPWAAQQLECEIPDWPDLINSAKGMIPRPESSVAKAVQPDDRYDALAIMEFMRLELVNLGVAKPLDK